MPEKEAVFQPLEHDDPTAVAGYRLTARLGAGGMGRVYLSYTPGGRPVAIKVIRPEFAADPEFRRRFQQEVAAAQQVQGLYTAPVIDSDTEGQHPWLATAYVAGPPLSSAVTQHGGLPVPTVLFLVAGVAEALQVIHGAAIIHRDLKPSNVLLSPDGPRVIDFGIARAADSTSLTSSGVTVGTPAFMAPEQAAGRAITSATDIFALGQVAAYAALGRPAFGEGATHGVLYRVVHEEPDLSGLPEALRPLVAACLAKDPAERPDLATVLRLCSAAADGTQLRRPEDWLPSALAADLSGHAPVPAPASVTTLPGLHQQHTATAVPPAGGFHSAGPGGPYGAQGGHPYGTQGGPPTAPSFPPAAPPGQSPTKPRRGKRLLLTVAVAVICAVAGAGVAVYALGGDKGSDSASQSPAGKPGGTQEDGTSAPSKDSANPSDSGAPQESAGEGEGDPEPVTYEEIDLPEEYDLSLSDEPVRPTQDGEADIGYDSGEDDNGRFYAHIGPGKLILLEKGEEGSLDTCRTETRYTEQFALTSLTAGAQFCMLTEAGHIGLVTYRGKSSGGPSAYVTLDLTVWRNAMDVDPDS